MFIVIKLEPLLFIDNPLKNIFDTCRTDFSNQRLKIFYEKALAEEYVAKQLDTAQQMLMISFESAMFEAMRRAFVNRSPQLFFATKPQLTYFSSLQKPRAIRYNPRLNSICEEDESFVREQGMMVGESSFLSS